MSSRTILSRPRTRVYDANYNIGESYYKSALDRLDRKYSGRPTTPPRNPSLPKDILERHERAFADEDLSTSRRRAEKHITESNILDGFGSHRAGERALELLEGDLDDEVLSKLKRIRASKKQSVIDDLDLENMVSNISTRRMKERSDKLMESVGINESSRKALNEDISFKKRSLKVTYDDSADSNQMTKWTPLVNKEEDTAAALRARISRARLEELEDESNALVERQAARERRAAKLRSIMAENEDNNDMSAVQSLRISSRKEKKTVEF